MPPLVRGRIRGFSCASVSLVSSSPPVRRTLPVLPPLVVVYFHLCFRPGCLFPGFRWLCFSKPDVFASSLLLVRAKFFSSSLRQFFFSPPRVSPAFTFPHFVPKVMNSLSLVSPIPSAVVLLLLIFEHRAIPAACVTSLRSRLPRIFLSGDFRMRFFFLPGVGRSRTERSFIYLSAVLAVSRPVGHSDLCMRLYLF